MPLWLKEDCPSFDIAGAVASAQCHKEDVIISQAYLFGKSEGILGGKPILDGIFSYLGCSVEWLVEEGCDIMPIQHLATVTGKIKNVLAGERIALNIMARISGIATKSHRISAKIAINNMRTRLAGSRKTTPGFRLFEKYALLIGGCDPHRYDLSSCVMIKDNVVDLFRGHVALAVKAAKGICSFTTKVEIECRNGDEAQEALQSECDIIMLDNFGPESAIKTAREIKIVSPQTIVEVSGGITEDNILSYCSDDVDYISMGSLTQDFKCVDFSLKFHRP